MNSIVTFLWNDPLMTGGKGTRVSPSPRPRNAIINLNERVSYRDRRRGVMPPQRLRSTYAPGTPRSFKHDHVRALAKSTKPHLTIPYRFICVTDELPKEERDDGVEWILMPPAALELGNLRTPEGARFPSCYRRLWAWSDEAAELLGEWIMVWDIDLVPVRNMDKLFARTEDFVGWRPYRDWGAKLRYGGGIYRMRAGSRAFVYNDFHGAESIREARAAGFRGSDQAWISYKLAGREPYYDRKSGIYSIRDLGSSLDLPHDAVLVQFNGHVKPWQYNGPGTWVAQHWRG